MALFSAYMCCSGIHTTVEISGRCRKCQISYKLPSMKPGIAGVMFVSCTILLLLQSSRGHLCCGDYFL